MELKSSTGKIFDSSDVIFASPKFIDGLWGVEVVLTPAEYGPGRAYLGDGFRRILHDKFPSYLEAREFIERVRLWQD